MKIYRYRVTEKQKILIDGVEHITCYGGSNISEEDARLRAKEKAEKVQRIVLGKEFHSRDSQTDKLMNEFNCDKLYMTLCQKQGCFRARLTPKPQRMKMRRYKVQFPRTGNDAELQGWLADYERESRNYSVCTFIEQVGARHNVDGIVHYHDEITGAAFRQPLA